MSNLIDHAHRELQRAGFFDRDSDYSGGIAEAVMPLVGVLASQGHSGGSVTAVVEIFSKLALFEPLSPLTDDGAEWNLIEGSKYSEPHWQSARKSSCFSADGGKTYYDIAEPRDNYGQRVIHKSLEREKSANQCEAARPPETTPPAGDVVALRDTERRD